MRILFVSQYYPPEIGALAARASELCQFWANAGHEVSVLTVFPNYPHGIIPEQYRGKRYVREREKGVNIHRTYIKAGHYGGIFNRVLSYFSFLYSGIWYGRKITDPQDIIIASSPPIFVAVIGYALSRIKRLPFIFEVRDLWPESIIQVGGVRNSLIIGILKWLERFLYNRAKYIVVVTESFRTYITAMGQPADKISIIKNGVDIDFFKPDPSHVQKYDKKAFQVGYVGNHGMAQGLNTLLEAAEILQPRSNIIFRLVGDGAEKPRLRELARAKELTNIEFLDSVSKQELVHIYMELDVVVVPLRKLELFAGVIPSKIFEIMAMQKVICLGVPGEVKTLVIDKAEAGIFFEPENAGDLARQIVYLIENPVVAKQLGENGREYVCRYYSRKELARQYAQILTNILDDEQS
jgi:colanic acid biosynthesis glycosyl transferase WcaI